LSKRASPSAKRYKYFGATIGVAILGAIFGSIGRFHFDLSEDRRNSFPKEHETILSHVPGELKIRVALSADDPRYKDLKRNVLSKLERTLPSLSITIVSTGKSDLFGVGSDEAYGLNEYEYQGKIQKSRSTSPREILPIIYELTGNTSLEVTSGPYLGYPLVLDPSRFEALFYLGLPLFFLFLLWWNHRIPNSYGGNK
jgi:hypothetical protein